MTLAPHPRLYLGPAAVQRLRVAPALPLLARAAAQLEADVAEFVRAPRFDWDRNTHNAHLLRARTQQRRIISLLVQWLRTGDRRFRESAVAHLEQMAGWECWSWITWRQNNPAPDAIFDLSYGENAATLAVAWDLLAASASPAERDLLLGMARKWVVPSFLKHTAAGQEMWWYKPEAHNCNWLAVCAGGAGLLALAMAEDLPDAGTMLARADAGVTAFMRSLTRSGGGWPEGVVYWNYGMRYAFMYLLAHEQATGQPHPAFAIPETLETLRFPLEFAPAGNTCAFGDIATAPWLPVALHYAAATRLNAADVRRGLDAQPHEAFDDNWASVPELLALHPGTTADTTTARGDMPAVKLYAGLGWARMADAMPAPVFYVAIRGGRTSDPHNSADLLSWHCLVNGERLVSSLTNSEYLDTTFGARRFDLAELRADTKNTILIGGVGMAQPATSETTQVEIAGLPGVRIDATAGYQAGGFDGPTVLFVGRLFLWLPAPALLIIDHIELKHTNRIETRLHTYAQLAVHETGATITGERRALRIALAASALCRTATSLTTPTNPADPQAHVLRWATVGLEAKTTLVTLAAPGAEPLAVSVAAGVADALTVVARSRGWEHRIGLTARLKALAGGCP